MFLLTQVVVCTDLMETQVVRPRIKIKFLCSKIVKLHIVTSRQQYSFSCEKLSVGVLAFHSYLEPWTLPTNIFHNSIFKRLGFQGSPFPPSFILLLAEYRTRTSIQNEISNRKVDERIQTSLFFWMIGFHFSNSFAVSLYATVLSTYKNDKLL